MIGKIRNLSLSGGGYGTKTKIAFFAGTGTLQKGDITLSASLENKYVFFILNWASAVNGNLYGAIYKDVVPKQVFTTSYYSGNPTTNTITITSYRSIKSEGNAKNSGWSYGTNAVVIGTDKDEVIAKAKSLVTISQLATIYDFTT